MLSNNLCVCVCVYYENRERACTGIIYFIFYIQHSEVKQITQIKINKSLCLNKLLKFSPPPRNKTQKNKIKASDIRAI